MGLHHLAMPSAKLEHARNPSTQLPRSHDLAPIVMKHTPIAHRRSPNGKGDYFAKRVRRFVSDTTILSTVFWRSPACFRSSL